MVVKKKKDYLKTIMYFTSIILTFTGLVSIGYGFGFLFGQLDMTHTVFDKYEMNITIDNLNCEQKTIFIMRILLAILNGTGYIWFGLMLILFSVIVDIFKKKRGVKIW